MLLLLSAHVILNSCCASRLLEDMNRQQGNVSVLKGNCHQKNSLSCSRLARDHNGVHVLRFSLQ